MFLNNQNSKNFLTTGKFTPTSRITTSHGTTVTYNLSSDTNVSAYNTNNQNSAQYQFSQPGQYDQPYNQQYTQPYSQTQNQLYAQTYNQMQNQQYAQPNNQLQSPQYSQPISQLQQQQYVQSISQPQHQQYAQPYSTQLHSHNQNQNWFSGFNTNSPYPNQSFTQPQHSYVPGAIVQPNIDISETSSDVIVVAHVGNVSVTDINLSTSENSVTITASGWIENQNVSLNRTVALPTSIKAEAVDASLQSGLLEIKCPKVERAHRNRVIVKADHYENTPNTTVE